ncbi:MAG: DUF4846 domain-containing protein [Myxococcales bacterium]|nr:DUF4846 domain-containing protein [Myxococcota bacterium]MDW8281459.1 DUF4846 domain-containing protein [Myxococcales bacterium]
MLRTWVLALLLVTLPLQGAPLPYTFPHAPDAQPLSARIPPPPGAQRVSLPERSFGAFLRHLPLLPAGSEVLLFDGSRKARQDVHAAVVDLDVGRRDLQQCADAAMRLWAEYLFALGQPERIRFHPDPGRPRELAFAGGRDRKRLERFLVRVFAEAGSASLERELRPVGTSPIEPGDVIIQGGYPGHAVVVLDVAEGNGRRFLLLGQSFMPAQQFHVLNNLSNPELSPWYDAADLDSKAGLQTPEWRPFFRRDVRRFGG